MSPAFLIMVVTLCSAFVCFTVARERGADATFLIWMAILFGPFAVPFVFFSKAKSNTDSQE